MNRLQILYKLEEGRERQCKRCSYGTNENCWIKSKYLWKKQEKREEIINWVVRGDSNKYQSLVEGNCECFTED